jgi:hypothetical protein
MLLILLWKKIGVLICDSDIRVIQVIEFISFIQNYIDSYMSG